MNSNSDNDKTLNSNTCRICLESKCVNVITLDKQNGWLQLFEYCFGLELSSHDIPRVICMQCADIVKHYSKFKKQCHKSDKFWKSLIHNNRCTEKTKENKFDELLEVEENSNNDCSNDNIDKDIKDNEYNTGDDIKVFVNGENMNKFVKTEHSLSSELINGDILLEDVRKPAIHSNMKNQKVHSSRKIGMKVKDSFTCEGCQKSYASQLWYQRHSKLCSSMKQKPNTVCNDQEYKAGTEINSKETHIECNFEENIYNNKVQQDSQYYCGLCKFTSDNLEDVNKHLDQHWANHDLQCMVCDFVGKDQAAIAAHRYTHSTTKASSFLCHICQKKTKSQLTLQFHYRKVHLNKSGGLCSQPQCNKVYNSWRWWKAHEKLHNHPGYVCDICGQKYKHRHLIIEHLMNHTNPPSHVCDVCGKTFLRLRNLRVHIDNVHANPEPIKCSHCNHMFKNEHYLRVHQRRMAMDKIWKCEFCPMEYPMLSELNTHMRSHSEERPHCCHICGSRYKGKGHLIVHMRNHTGNRPFKCMLCAKAFTSNTQLKTHTIIHTGILPYKCSHCEKAFRSKKRMLKHCELTHKALETKTVGSDLE